MKSTEDLTRNVLQRAAIIKEKQRAARRRTGVAAAAFALALTVGLGAWGVARRPNRQPDPTLGYPTNWIDAQTVTEEPTIGVGPTEVGQSCYAAGVRYQGKFYSELVQLDDAHAQQFLERLDRNAETLLGDTRDVVNQANVTYPSNADMSTQTAATDAATMQPPTAVPDDRTAGYGIQGMLYTVQPYDPQQILAVVGPHDDGTASVWLVWRPGNQPAQTGRDYLENVLHLTDRVERANWMADDLGSTYQPLQVDAAVLQKLVRTLNAAPVTRPTEQEYGALSEGGKRYVQLTAADGLQIELTLFENGQVEVQGMYDDVHKCQQLLQPDDPVIQEIRNACK
ncbi:MAG: hypothetical protein II621_10340 [Clostridia bacterium]|nr:hypothetical protein [Clostridia bacterium]